MSEDSGGNVNILELKELLEAYNKYMEQVNEFYYFTSEEIIIVPSTTPVPIPKEEKKRRKRKRDALHS